MPLWALHICDIQTHMQEKLCTDKNFKHLKALEKMYYTKGRISAGKIAKDLKKRKANVYAARHLHLLLLGRDCKHRTHTGVDKGEGT